MKSFKEKVFLVVKNVKRGKTITYKEVAEIAGRPNAWRVVGNTLNRNPNPIKIPCHRVIKSDGTVGGYKYGVKRKTSLLFEEGVIIKKRRVVL
ncbi:MAG: MGMT family protein [Candidatus Nealsonbacteria bacterium]